MKNNDENTQAGSDCQERLVLPLDFEGWVPIPDGDGCGWMAFPVRAANPDGFWEVTDCEGDTLCICQKETAVWLHMLLNKFEDQIDINGDRTGYCNRIAAEMADGNVGMGGSWDEFIRENASGQPPRTTRKFDVHYYSHATGEKRWSHKYAEEWEKLETHCPKCAAKEVWHETGPGDYYVDEQYMCASCGATFYMPGGVRVGDGEQDVQRLECLKAPNV